MPRIGDDEVQNFKTGHFGFSAANPTKLGSSEYTLVTVALDDSGSVSPFRGNIIKGLKEIVKSCQFSPRADSLMLRVLIFGSHVVEAHGFKPLANCNLGDYDNMPSAGASTALYDASVDAITATTGYGKTLIANDMSVNGIVFVVTDGEDNNSTLTVKTVHDALAGAVTDETLESLVSVLIGVNVTNGALAQYLADFKTNAGFTQYIELDNATAGKLAKLAEFVSKSISAQSQALGTGGPSKQLSLTV